MMETKKIPLTAVILGGDGRMVHTARVLEAAGCTVTLYGQDKGTSPPVSLEKIVHAADLIVLPIPVTRDGVHLNAPLSSEPIPLSRVGGALRSGQTVATGTLPATLAGAICAKGCLIYDYQADECFAIRNALATAEGAIAMAINTSPDLLADSRCAVIGYGRIGKQLCRMLTAMGAKVTVIARKASDRTLAKTMGCKAVPFSEGESILQSVSLIFNTVPRRLFDFAAVGLAPYCTVIDLAPVYEPSDSPRLLCGAALPAKFAPRFAGRLIGECILAQLRKGGDTV